VLALEANVREFVKKYAAGETSIDAFLTSLSEQDVEVVDRETVDEGRRPTSTRWSPAARSSTW
jgi:hypothetical protein